MYKPLESLVQLLYWKDHCNEGWGLIDENTVVKIQLSKYYNFDEDIVKIQIQFSENTIVEIQF